VKRNRESKGRRNGMLIREADSGIVVMAVGDSTAVKKRMRNGMT
jgi:hypothetical protein